MMKVLIGVDPHKDKGSLAVAAVEEASGESLRREPRACRLLSRPLRLEVPRTLGEAVPRASLGCRQRRHARSEPGGKAGGLRRVGGGRAAQALCAGAGAL